MKHYSVSGRFRDVEAFSLFRVSAVGLAVLFRKLLNFGMVKGAP